MNRRDLIRQLRRMAKEQESVYSEHEGGKHTVVSFDGKQVPVPRHSEINELTAKSIIKYMSGE